MRVVAVVVLAVACGYISCISRSSPSVPAPSPAPSPVRPPVPVPSPPSPNPAIMVPCYNSVPPANWKWSYKELKVQIDPAKIEFVPCKGGEIEWVYFVSYGEGWVGTAGRDSVATGLFLAQFQK